MKTKTPTFSADTLKESELFSHPQLKVSKKVSCHSLQAMKEVAKQCLETYIWTRSIVLLYGDIGAGKSTFVRLCLELLDLVGVSYPFSSPSFSLVNEYHSSHIHITNNTNPSVVLPHTIKSIQHVDLYRLQSQNELYDIDIFSEEYSLYFVEWPNKISYKFFTQLQIPISALYFTILDENSRSITFTHPSVYNQNNI